MRRKYIERSMFGSTRGRLMGLEGLRPRLARALRYSSSIVQGCLWFGAAGGLNSCDGTHDPQTILEPDVLG
jgi:hypothetical protein